MSDQDGTPSSTKQRRSRKTSTANQQNGKRSNVPQLPTNDVEEGWQNHWKQKGQPWRTEPEIDAERQKYLDEWRGITPDNEQGNYPFKDIKLTRADVEWLLATHENGRGPVDWSDEKQRTRIGLDLRGADLRSVDLSFLPLTRMEGSGSLRVTNIVEWQVDIVAIHLEGANLRFTHLEGVGLFQARLDRVRAYGVHLEKANLSKAYLDSADLSFSHLQNVNLLLANLENATLKGAHLEGANIAHANLAGATLCNVFFDRATQLDNVVLSNKQFGSVRIVDVRWGDVNLAVMKWSQVSRLGDEHEARKKQRDEQMKDRDARLEEYERAVRANRQLAVALQTQGLNEDAARFAYRAQKLQRIVSLKRSKFGQYFFSLILDLLAGYGYRPGRSVVWYLMIIFGFALTFHVLGGLTLFPPDAFVFSIMSFHGRGFFPSLSSETNLHNPLVIIAAVEAIVGLLIEISFIATFTQRFFGK